MALAPSNTETKVLALRRAGESILTASLRRDPASPRAAQALIEAIALWEGATVRAALVVPEKDAGSETTLCRDLFTDFGTTPLYTLDWIHRAAARARRADPRIRGDASFRQLARLLVTEVAR
jgi:hypothetical protein